MQYEKKAPPCDLIPGIAMATTTLVERALAYKAYTFHCRIMGLGMSDDAIAKSALLKASYDGDSGCVVLDLNQCLGVQANALTTEDTCVASQQWWDFQSRGQVLHVPPSRAAGVPPLSSRSTLCQSSPPRRRCVLGLWRILRPE